MKSHETSRKEASVLVCSFALLFALLSGAVSVPTAAQNRNDAPDDYRPTFRSVYLITLESSKPVQTQPYG